MSTFQHLFNPRVLIVTWPVFLFSLSLHEFLHAWTADRLGDPTARYLGRLTLNPLAHYDIIGTTMGLVFRCFGWAKPVPVNAAVFRWPKRDMMLTALGGPASNFALAFCFGLIFKLLQVRPPGAWGAAGPTVQLAEQMAGYGVFINIALALFNLIPLYPLDGHHILRGFLSFRAAIAYDRTKHFGSYILILIILLGFSRGFSVIARPMLFIMNVAFTRAEFLRLREVVMPLLG